MRTYNGTKTLGEIALFARALYAAGYRALSREVSHMPPTFPTAVLPTYYLLTADRDFALWCLTVTLALAEGQPALPALLRV